MRWSPLIAVALLTACSGDRSVTTTPSRSGGPESAQITTSGSIGAGGVGTPTTDDDRSTTAATNPATNPATTPATTPERPVVGDPSVALEFVGEFDRPVDLAVRPGDDSLWLVEQTGRVVRFDGSDRSIALDLTGRVGDANEQGLLGLEFSPDGTLAYTNHTDTTGTTVITEWSVAADASLDPSSERTVLTVDQPFENHNAGDLAFDAYGMLFIPLGDGGGRGDPGRRASDPTSLLGSLLRIDPRPSGERAYSIPPDNPFADGPLDGVDGAPEVWAWGLRNPWKIDVDPVERRLWIADVGQNEFEEINAVGPSATGGPGYAGDFGWSAFEGRARFNTDVPDTGRTIPPVLTYDHGDGCSISGGAVYRGGSIAELEPAYVYSDFCTSSIWAFDLAGARNLTLVDGLTQVTAVRSGPDGELYVLQRDGPVFRLVPA